MGDKIEFTTTNRYQKIYYRITSSAINFEVKASENAVIGLSRKIRLEDDYLVVVGDNGHSWIKKYHGTYSKEKAETPDILSRQEYRRFWITWNDNTIRFSGEGHSNPIVSYNNSSPTINLKYVTFFVFNESPYPVHWKVELPPVIEKPIMKPMTDGELYWVPINANTHVLPDEALIGGYEKENLYIIRAEHRGSLTPGKFVPAQGKAYISWGGNEHEKNTFEVLCGYNCMWVPCTRNKIPVGAITSGYSENIEHEKLYIGRAKHLNHIIPGKVQPSHEVCYLPYGGKEIQVDSYEILVNPKKSRCANTLLVPHCDTNDDYDSDISYDV